MNIHASNEPICVTVNEAARMLGIGRTKLYALISSGELEVVKIGRATRVTTTSMRELILRHQSPDWACK